jgi:hypothetical protein
LDNEAHHASLQIPKSSSHVPHRPTPRRPAHPRFRWRRGNIVGGGFADASGGGQDVRISYANPNIGNRSAGVPVFTGGTEGNVAFIVMPNSTKLASRRSAKTNLADALFQLDPRITNNRLN